MFTPLMSLVSGLRFGLEHITPLAWVMLFVLVFLSTISWAILLMKWLLLIRTDQANLVFLEKFHESPHPLVLFLTKEQVELSPLYYVYHTAARELAFQLVGEEEPGRDFAARIHEAERVSPAQMSYVQNAMERAMVSAALRLQERLSLVATVVSVSPLIGILGTVIGLLDVFAGLDPQHKAALVPGVSSALITTIAALVVVIPSLAGYNTLMDRIRTMIARMDSFAFELCGVLGRQFVDHRKADEGRSALQSHGAPVMMSGTADANHHTRA